jgi:ribokinase
MKKKILVVSSANMDMVMSIKRVPEAGQTVIDKGSYTYVPGGKGANSAVAISRLGGKCTFLTRLGADANGDALLSLYEREGMDTSYIVRDSDTPTGLATIFVEESGQNRIIVFPGANQKISRDAIDKAIDSGVDALYMQFEINHDAILYSAKVASEKNIPIFIDAGPADKNLDLSKLAPVFVFSPNETETEIFTGIAPNDEESCVLAAKKLMETVKAKYYVLKLGGRGVGVYDGENLTLIPTYPVKVVDTTSAGDSFTAAMTLEYMRSGDILHACRYGNAVASITVSRAGAGESIPNSDELAAFLKENGIVL